MFLIKMINFCKGADCPTSQDIYAWQTNDLPIDVQQEVRDHIFSCDFCGAEAEFYARFPVADESEPTSEMPTPLMELAESLLKKGKGNQLLKNLLLENKGLKLNEV